MQPDLKEKKPVKDLTPVQQWDQLSFTLLYRELCPKGFKKILGGKKEVANRDYLSKESVKKCQNMAAQLVRSYREKLRKELKDMLASREKALREAQEKLSECHPLRFKKKNELLKEVYHYQNSVGALQIVISKLDSVDIK